ncbi:probable G-protein coupled receptor 34 [Lates calcarifer]|uniref:Probable G-protein coupled receptor 34 n=1 Tax=Lates calcarifer TaxID=8187 RepID=A0A4W6EJ13_LATCA|nr:probable G-protein coupled receptor 34 [Lates calcarifer]
MNMNTTSYSISGHPNPLQIPLAVLYSIIFILGLTGNLVALWVFFCVHSKKNSVRVFLINIAFADLLLVACLPFRILYHSQGDKWALHPILCKVVGNLFYMNMYISVTLLGLISVDRYLKIHRSAGMQHSLQSTKWSSALCTVVWITSFVTSSAFLIPNKDQHNNLQNNTQTNRCFHYKKLIGVEWKAYINIFVIMVFWLVFISLVVSYGKIATRLLRTSEEKSDLPNAARYARIARKSFFILFVFTVCFVPYHIVRVFYIKTQLTPNIPPYWEDVADKANEVALVFSALNSCLDPVMYFLLSSSVRKEVLHLVGSVFCVQDVAGVSGSSSTMDMDGRNERVNKEQANISLTSNLKEKADTESNLAGL